MAMTISHERSRNSATSDSPPTPCSRTSRLESLCASSDSSLKVSVRWQGETTAGACPWEEATRRKRASTVWSAIAAVPREATRRTKKGAE